MEQKSNGVFKAVLVILVLAGIAVGAAVLFSRMQKEIGALRYRLEQWMRLRPEPMTVDLVEE